jgi:hypothetical protein
VGGVPHEDIAPEVELRRSAAPELTRRELDVLTSLCRPALSDEAFVAPATAREIAADLVVTEAAVKQHLLRLYQKFRIPEGPNRRTRLANEVVALGLVRPLPPAERGGKAEPARPAGAGGPAPAAGPPGYPGPPGAGPPAPPGTGVPRGTAAQTAAQGAGQRAVVHSGSPGNAVAQGSGEPAGGDAPGGTGGQATREAPGPPGHGTPQSAMRDGMRVPRPRGLISRAAGGAKGTARAAGRRAS